MEKKRKKLTKKQREDYLDSPDHCPYCKSDNISGGRFQSDCNIAWQEIFCNDCEKSWDDVYKFVDIDDYSK